MILIVDDEESILDSVSFSLKFALKDDNCNIITAMTGQEAIDKYQQFHPDLIILDVMLPDESGIDVCKKIRALGNVPILFLSAKDQLEDKVLGLNIGGDDYIAKPFKFEELLARVKVLLRRSGYSSRVLSFADIVLDPDTRKVYKNSLPINLTLREYELLEMLMYKPHQVFTRRQILEKLWGWSEEIDTNVVEVYICALRNKLGDSSHTLLRTVRGVGYALG